MILYSSIPVLKRATFALLHYQDSKIAKIKAKIESAIMNIKQGEGVTISIGHFDVWMLKKGYYVAEMKVTVNYKNSNITNIETEKESKELDGETHKLEETIDSYTTINEIQNKIFSICKENRINEHYIDIS